MSAYLQLSWLINWALIIPIDQWTYDILICRTFHLNCQKQIEIILLHQAQWCHWWDHLPTPLRITNVSIVNSFNSTGTPSGAVNYQDERNRGKHAPSSCIPLYVPPMGILFSSRKKGTVCLTDFPWVPRRGKGSEREKKERHVKQNVTRWETQKEQKVW